MGQERSSTLVESIGFSWLWGGRVVATWYGQGRICLKLEEFTGNLLVCLYVDKAGWQRQGNQSSASSRMKTCVD